ncbi:MAG: PorP/SprF family type IX secretion system membrane protein [Bacteroidota bacterium]
MKFSRLLPILVLLFCCLGLSAQDVHYTLFNMSPLRTNPALTGAFNGTARIGGIHRGQWFNIDASIATTSFYADAPIIRGFRDTDWVGVGFNFLNDQAGAQDLITNIAGLSASYHLALDKKANSMLTLGATYGQNSRRLKGGEFLAEQNIGEEFGGGPTGTETEFANVAAMEDNTSYNDVSVGLLYRNQIDKTSKLELGIAALHVNAPNAGLNGLGATMPGPNPNPNPPTTGNPDDSDRRMTFITHGKFERPINEKWSMAPTFFWQTTEAGGNEIMLQAWVGRKVNEDMTLNFGLGGRTGDAAQILFGIDYQDWRTALSYDVNVSSATAITNGVGGFELAAYYIIKVYKTPELPPAVLCPKF